MTLYFKTDVKPWNELRYNSLICNRPNHPIEPMSGDFIEFKGVMYEVDRTVNTFVKLKEIENET